MSQSSLRELGMDLLVERQFERALGVFAEAVRRAPSDYRSRMLAAHCLVELGENERAVTAYHTCAEGLLKRDYLLSAMAACRRALDLNPKERRLHETLERLHSRAVRTAPGRAAGPPPLPPESLYDGQVEEDLMGLQGGALASRAMEVLAAADPGASADPEARPPLPLFADLEREAFLSLLPSITCRQVPGGELLCTEGDAGDVIYVLVAGKAEVSRLVSGQMKTLGFLGGGSIFGELAVLTGTSSTATVSTVVDTELFEIRREDLNALAKRFPSVTQVLATFVQNRMANNLMATSPLFQRIPSSERKALLARFSFKALQPQERALVEGEHSPGLFVVLAGELVVQKEDPAGGSVSLGVLREGEIAGEISLLTGLRATATVVATRKTATAFLDRADFTQLTQEYPDTQVYLQQLSERRLKQIGEALRPAEIIDADELVLEPAAEAPEAR